MLLVFFLYIVNLIKKSLTICLRQDSQEHFDLLRRSPGPL